MPDAAATRPSLLRRSPAVTEGVAALALGLLLTVIVRRPYDITASVPGHPRDPELLSWVLAWPAHALTSWSALWDANIFAPTPNSFAFTDALLGYLPFGLVGEGPVAAVIRYNVVLLFAFGLAFAGTWVLVRQLGLGRTAALVAAVAFAFNPWRLSQLNHLQILSSGGIPLAMAMLARGHGIHLRTGQGPIRPGWALAGWATAAWQVSLGFGLGLQLAYVLALCTAVAGVRMLLRVQRGAGWPPRRLLAANGIGLVLFLGTAGALAQPYLQAVEDHPHARRSIGEIEFWSPTPSAFVTAPVDSWAWGRYTANRRLDVQGLNEKALLPGLTVTSLAVAGLLLPGGWSRRRRILLTGAVVVIAAVALGTNGPFGGRMFLLVYDYLPGYQGIRTPGRLVTTAWLGLALLAAHGVTALTRALGGISDVRAAVASPTLALGLSLGLSAGALLEGLDTAPQTPVRPAPTSVRLADLPQPLMVLPSEDEFDERVMRWSTDGFPRVVNGVSGFPTSEQTELRDAAARLPDPGALDRLRRSGVRTLVLLNDALPGSRYVNASTMAGLPGVRVEPRGDVTVVYLDG